jgi:hypothetical protein
MPASLFSSFLFHYSQRIDRIQCKSHPEKPLFSKSVLASNLELYDYIG